MNSRKQIRVTLPAELAGKFEKQKLETERRLAVSLTDAQFAGMIIAQGIKTMEGEE
mgnify:CR=1 FL=1